MIAGKGFMRQKTVACRFCHPGTVHGQHIRMHPVFRRLNMVAGFRLRYLIRMVCRCKIHSSTMDIELGTEIFTAHCRTFDMPTWKPYAPGSWPAHDMLWFRFDPKCKIQPPTLFVLST